MSAEPTAQKGGRGSTSPRLLPADDLARDLTMAHAKTRAAGYLLTRDPSASGRALHDLTRHTRAALDALIGTRAQEAAHTRGAELPELLTGFRAGGGTLRISVTGPEQPLDPAAGSALRELACEMSETVAAHLPGADLSLSLTWSPDHLDVLVVGGLGPERPPGPAAVPADPFTRTRPLVAALAGTLRVTAPSAGGLVATVRLPLGRTPAEGDGPSAAGAVTLAGRGRPDARIAT